MACTTADGGSTTVSRSAERKRKIPVIVWLTLACSLAVTTTTTTPVRVVVVIPASSADDTDERVVSAVLAHTRAHGLQIEIVRPAQLSSPSLLIREGRSLAERWQAQGVLWIDLVPGGTSQIYVADPSRTPLYGRSLPAAGGGVSAQAEGVANVVSAVIMATFDGEREAGETPTGLEVVHVDAGSPRARAHPTASNRAQVAAWPRLRLAAGYAGNTFAAAIPWQSGLALAIGWRPAPRVLLDLDYQVMPSVAISIDVTDLALRRHPVTLIVGYARELGRLWDVRFLARAGVDVVRRTASASGQERTDDRAWIYASVGAAVGFGVRIAPPVRVGVSVGVEALLRRAEYVVYTPDRRVVLAPAPARLIVAAAVEFELVRRPGRRPEEKLTR